MLEIEKKLNYNFPNDYKDYICNNKPLKFRKIVKTKTNETVFGNLFSFDPNYPHYYILKFQNFDDSESNLVAIGLCAFGDLICFDKNTNNVVFYNHELGKNEFLANNFTDFLGNLTDFTDEE